MIGRAPNRSRQVARIVRLSPHEVLLPGDGLVDVGRNCVGAHGDAGIEAFVLFLSAFGFFFSRLLLSCPFAISSSILHRPSRRRCAPSRSFVSVSRLSCDVGPQFVLPKLQGLFLSRHQANTPREDPSTSEPQCRKRLVEIDGFVDHGYAFHKPADLVWKT